MGLLVKIDMGLDEGEFVELGLDSHRGASKDIRRRGCPVNNKFSLANCWDLNFLPNIINNQNRFNLRTNGY